MVAWLCGRYVYLKPERALNWCTGETLIQVCSLVSSCHTSTQGQCWTMWEVIFIPPFIYFWVICSLHQLLFVNVENKILLLALVINATTMIKFLFLLWEHSVRQAEDWGFSFIDFWYWTECSANSMQSSSDVSDSISELIIKTLQFQFQRKFCSNRNLYSVPYNEAKKGKHSMIFYYLLSQVSEVILTPKTCHLRNTGDLD